jgi:hypothetical protein
MHVTLPILRGLKYRLKHLESDAPGRRCVSSVRFWFGRGKLNHYIYISLSTRSPEIWRSQRFTMDTKRRIWPYEPCNPGEHCQVEVSSSYTACMHACMYSRCRSDGESGHLRTFNHHGGTVSHKNCGLPLVSMDGYQQEPCPVQDRGEPVGERVWEDRFLVSSA